MTEKNEVHLPLVSETRAKLAYSVFRGGFREGGPDAPPHWDNLPPNMRDAITVAYLQGKLDGASKPTARPGQQMIDASRRAYENSRGGDSQ